VALEHHQVNVVVIRLATKTVRQVIARIHRRPQLATTRTLEAEVAVTLLRDRSMTAQRFGTKHAEYAIKARSVSVNARSPPSRGDLQPPPVTSSRISVPPEGRPQNSAGHEH